MKVLCLLAVFFLLASTVAQAVAVGVSPARLDFPNVLRGGYAEKRFTVSTSSEEIMFGHIAVEGGIKDWVRFPGNVSTFNATASSPAVITIIVQPPPDAAVGRYGGKIIAIGDATGTIAGRAGSIIQASVAMDVAVSITGDEIKSCKAGAFQFQDVEVGKPLELWMTVENNGNVKVLPLVSYDLFDQGRENLVESKDIGSPEILPTQTLRFSLTSPNTLETDQYWATIEVPECDSEALVTFSVVEKGQIADQGELVELRAVQDAAPFDTIPVTASFINKGQRIVTAHFKGTVTLKGKIIAVIESEKLEVQPGENALLEAFFTPKSPGKYEISGRVLYNEKLTFEKGIALNVAEGEKKSGLDKLPLALIAYAMLVVAAFFIVRALRKRRIEK